MMLAAIIDGPTVGAIIIAIIGGFAAAGARMAPKTRSEAGVDRSQARKNDADAWAGLIDRQDKTIERQDEKIEGLELKIDELENAQAEERRECDRKIGILQERLEELGVRLPEQRVWFFDDDPSSPTKT
jgi:predicted RNase H-like nuclease (RuvC/YqgF family)